MKKFFGVCLCLACLLSMLTGCGGQAEITEVKKASKDEVTAISEAVKKGLAEGLVDKSSPKLPNHGDIEVTPKDSYERAQDMFSLVEKPNENTLYSPASLDMAFGLLSESASQEARAQILEYLGVSDYSEVAKALMEHSDIVNMPDETAGGLEASDSAYKTALHYANSLWVNNKYSLNSDFLNIAQSSYRATSDEIDVKDPEGACEKINSWCEKTTQGLIPTIVSPLMIKPDLSVILCNSLYFESAWWEPWYENAGQFTNSNGEVVELDDMLYDTVDSYYEVDNAIAFSKEYVSGAKFIGILPDEGVSIKDIDLKALIASETTEYDVHASMPKLNYDFTCQTLADSLKSLGVTTVFDKNAGGLPGLVNESDELYVSSVLQKCKIELDENGTKAAAVTAIFTADNAAFGGEPTPVKEVHLNRPFYYMIVDDIDVPGTVLFIGAVNTIEGTQTPELDMSSSNG